MKEVRIKDSALRDAAEQGMDAFVKVVADAIMEAADGSIVTLMEGARDGIYTSDQVTLIAYLTLRDEVMDGGFVQLIHNGYGGFIFLNPFAKAMKQWGLRDLSKLIYSVHSLYNAAHEDIEQDCSDEEFMALFEQHPEFDDADDTFVENEEEYTAAIAEYIDNNTIHFATIDAE